MVSFLGVLGSIVSLLAFYGAVFQLGRIVERRAAARRKSDAIAPRNAFAAFRTAVEAVEPTDIDVVGYSVHTLISETMPQIKRALAAGKRVRILVLDPASMSLLEKSSMEHSGARLDLASFMRRTGRNVARVVTELQEMAAVLTYQHNLQQVRLDLRYYESIPIWRGLRGESVAVFSTYLRDMYASCRDFPMRVVNKPGENQDMQVVRHWFDYLWRYRSRPVESDVVLFDLYDTVLTIDESARLAAQREMADSIGVPLDGFTTAWRETMKSSNRGEFPETSSRFLAVMRMLGVETDLDLAIRLAELEHEMLRKNFRTAPNLVPFLRGLRRRGYRTALVSNCSPSAVQVIEASDLGSLFDTQVLSFRHGTVKPEPEIYRTALDRLAATTGKGFFIGDGANDELTGAARVGLRPIRVQWARRDDNDPAAIASAFDFREVATLIDAEAAWIW